MQTRKFVRQNPTTFYGVLLPMHGGGENSLQGFDFEAVHFNKAMNMYEQMDIEDSVFEGVVGTSTEKN